MKTSSKKAKGHRLEKLVRQRLLHHFPLTEDDIRITVSGETGEDLKLSKRAQDILGIKIECKNRAKLSVYTFYEQAQKHPGDNLEPVVIVKMNRRKPLAIVDLEYFLQLIRNNNE